MMAAQEVVSEENQEFTGFTLYILDLINNLVVSQIHEDAIASGVCDPASLNPLESLPPELRSAMEASYATYITQGYADRNNLLQEKDIK